MEGGGTSHLICVAWLVTLLAFGLDRGGLAQEALPSEPTVEKRRRVVFDGRVLEPDGTPAEGAVVVSDFGGQAVADTEGGFLLVVDVPIGVSNVRITAIGGSRSGLLAGTSVATPRFSGRVPIGMLRLASGTTCESGWLPAFGGQPGTNNFVFALTVFDDGNGPALFVGGSFQAAGSVLADSVAKWDGSSWAAVGNDLEIATILTLVVFDDGGGEALYAGGQSSTGGAGKFIAKWNGSNWVALGSGVDGTVNSLTVFDDGGGDALYAGGAFATAGGAQAPRVAKWDGVAWSALGSLSTVNALTVFNDGGGDALYAGTTHTSLAGVWKWDGSTWSILGGAFGGAGTLPESVNALAVFDDGGGPKLIAGGRFTSADGVPANRIAQWDGTSWSALGSGVSPSVRALTVYDDGGGEALYAGTGDTSPGGVRKWDGTTWTSVGSGGGDNVLALTTYDVGSESFLVAGGSFTSMSGVPASRVALWDGTTWEATGSGLNALVRSLAVFDDGSGSELYAAGRFTTAGGVPVNRVAKWDGSTWVALGTGVNDFAEALTVFDDGSGMALYVGGYFTFAGGVPANRIAKWNGSVWSALGSGLNERVLALTVFDDGGGPALFAGGQFTTAGGGNANGIARWGGVSWTALGSGLEGGVANALSVFDDGGGEALYVGGAFTSAGGMSANRLAKWDGASWSALGSGVDNTVYALVVFDDGDEALLCAGGLFTMAGGGQASNIAKWDGSTWSSLGTGMNGAVQSLAVFDDGNGQALFAGGSFTTAGGLAASAIAKWDGGSWSALGSGTGSNCLAQVVFDDGGGPALYAGGGFNIAFDSGDSYLAKWRFPDTVAPTITCPADVTVECTGPSGAVATFEATGEDILDPTPTIDCTPPSGSTFPDGTTTVTCTATDACGNSSMCSFDVTVEDTTPPVPSCPGDITIECTSPAGEVVSFTPTATDVCDPSPMVVAAPPSGSTFALGTTTVTVTATDASGNEEQCAFDVTVEDTTPPTITCPADMVLECASFIGGGTPVSFTATASDACDPSPTVVCVPPSNTLFPLGITTVTCTATDDSGNSSQCSFDVTIQDTTPPVIDCPDTVLVPCADPKGEVVTFSASATDDCDVNPSVSCAPPSGSVFPLGTTTVTCTAMDVSGYVTMCEFDVTLQAGGDMIPPVVTCPPNQTVKVGVPVFYSASATDDCDGSVPASCSPPSGSTFPPGTTLVTCMATDSSGNTGFCSFTVTAEASLAVPAVGPRWLLTLALLALVLGSLVLWRRADPA